MHKAYKIDVIQSMRCISLGCFSCVVLLIHRVDAPKTGRKLRRLGLIILRVSDKANKQKLSVTRRRKLLVVSLLFTTMAV